MLRISECKVWWVASIQGSCRTRIETVCCRLTELRGRARLHDEFQPGFWNRARIFSPGKQTENPCNRYHFFNSNWKRNMSVRIDYVFASQKIFSWKFAFCWNWACNHNTEYFIPVVGAKFQPGLKLTMYLGPKGRRVGKSNWKYGELQLSI